MYFAVQGLFAGVATGLGTGVVLVALKQSHTIEFMTLISAIAVLVSFATTFILPKSIVDLGKVEEKKSN